MTRHQAENSSTCFYTLTPGQEDRYDALDAQGGRSPDEIRSVLGIEPTTAVPTVVRSVPPEGDATVARLVPGSRYGRNRHVAPSDRDVDPWSEVPPFHTLSKSKDDAEALWHSAGYLAATAALEADKKSHRPI